MALMDETTLPISCECGYAEEKQIAWLKDNRSFHCPSCGVLIKIEGLDEAIAVLEELDKVTSSSDVTVGGKR